MSDFHKNIILSLVLLVVSIVVGIFVKIYIEPITMFIAGIEKTQFVLGIVVLGFSIAIILLFLQVRSLNLVLKNYLDAGGVKVRRKFNNQDRLSEKIGKLMANKYFKVGFYVAVVIFLICAGVILKNQYVARQGQALIEAVKEGDIYTVQILLRGYVDINIKTEKAMEWKYLLFPSDFDSSMKIAKGSTPLIIAIGNSRHYIAKILLKNGADANARDCQQRTALMFAVTAGDIDTIERLLDANVDVNAKDKDERTALMFASIAFGDKREVVKVLLEKGAQVNTQDREGKTALMYAAYEGNEEVVKTLLVNEAIDADVSDKSGDTALMKTLWGHRRRESSRQTLDDKTYMRIVRALLDKGVDVDAQNKNGWTALMYATRKECMGVIKPLLDNKADADITNKDGDNALTLAMRYNERYVIEWQRSVIDLLFSKTTIPKSIRSKGAENYLYNKWHLDNIGSVEPTIEVGDKGEGETLTEGYPEDMVVKSRGHAE